MSIPVINDSNMLTIFLGFLIAFATGLIGYLLSRIITPRRRYPMKFKRYEAGNPPKGKARGWFMMQYYAYLIVFLTVEPILIYLFILILGLHSHPISTSIIFMIFVLVLLPPLIFGLDSAKRVKLWFAEEKQY